MLPIVFLEESAMFIDYKSPLKLSLLVKLSQLLMIDHF